MEIIEGIHQLKAPMPGNVLRYTLVYLIKGEGGYVLVDAGSSVPGAIEAVGEQLKALHVDFPDIKQIVVTHLHPDHYGLSGAIRERSGGVIVTHERTRENLRARAHGRGPASWGNDEWARKHGLDPEEEQRFWRDQMTEMSRRGNGRPDMGMGSFHPPAMAEPDVTVQGGETIEFVSRRFEVIFTPGHSPDHICLYDRERKVLFTGDHILPVITPHVSYMPDSDTDPLGDYIAGLETLRVLDVEHTLPAHEFTISNLEERVQELERHHEERNQFVLDALAEGPKTAYEITSRVRWDVGSWESMHPGLRRSALNECMSHLEYLRRRGKVETVEEGDRVFFKRV